MVKFSIIVVCFNAGNKLIGTVNSILAQDYADYEVIIKDGLSTDNSLGALPKDKRIKVFSSEDKGIYDAMNQAVGEASGDYYLFLNCGDSFHGGAVLKEAEAFMRQNPKSLLYYGNTYNEISESVVPMPAEITAFTCFRHIPCHQACFYAKELFEERQYDLGYHIRADYEHFLWGYFRKNANPMFLKLTVANYEGGGFSETKENLKIDKKEHRAITEKYMDKWQLMKYRAIMIVTMAPVRKFLSHQKGISVIYNKVKKMCYR